MSRKVQAREKMSEGSAGAEAGARGGEGGGRRWMIVVGVVEEVAVLLIEE